MTAPRILSAVAAALLAGAARTPAAEPGTGSEPPAEEPRVEPSRLGLWFSGDGSFGPPRGDAVPLGARLGLRLGIALPLQVQALVSGDSMGARHAARVAADRLVLLAVGPALETGAWLVQAAAGLGARQYAFDDVWGTGRSSGSLAAVGARGGLVYRIPVSRLVVARVGLDGTLAWSGRDRDRFRQAEIGSWVAFFSGTLGLEVGGALR